MRITGFIVSLIALLLIQIACNSEPKTEQEEPMSEKEQLYKEVMEIHDSVMPKMSDINRVKRKLSDLLESDSLMNDDAKELISQGTEALEAAENAMMDWMRAFKAPKPTDPDQLVIQYLNEEKLNILKVSRQMLNSLEKGEELLKQFEKDTKVNSNN